MFLIGNDIPDSLFSVFKLSKLDKKHVIHLLHILFHVVIGHPSGQLVLQGLISAIEIGLQVSNLLIVLLVCWRVLLKPELGVRNHSVHSFLVVFMFGLVVRHVGHGIGDLSNQFLLILQHQFLHLVHFWLLRIEFLFHSQSSVNLCLQIHLDWADLLLGDIILLVIVWSDRLKFLILLNHTQSEETLQLLTNYYIFLLMLLISKTATWSFFINYSWTSVRFFANSAVC